MEDSDLRESMLRRGIRLEDVIGSGGFGDVYRARQLVVDREVAVKVLHLSFDREPARLFEDEIRAIGKLDHPNVVRIFEAATPADERPYFSMELLRGPTLHQLAETGPLPQARAVELTCQLLDGLSAVHSAGHIHADVKPSNVMITHRRNRECAVLIDFGLSRLRDSEARALNLGGTRPFMAPEQLKHSEVDARSDVFSAALVLLRLLSGWQRSEEHPHPPLQEIADLSLRAALESALVEQPAQRPTAAAFALALRGGAPPPFRQLAPFTEADGGRLRGRSEDVLRVIRSLEHKRATVLTAPSGTGKTSLLRAGLLPALRASGAHAEYLACQVGELPPIAEALSPGSTSLAEAIRRSIDERAQRIVLILDQVEVLLSDEETATTFLGELLTLEARPAGARLSIVLAVREDFVARLIAISPALARGVPQVRIAPLSREAASRALRAPLEEHELAITDELLERLLDDLVRAGAAHGRHLGWQDGVVYPPHLQLAGAALFAALDGDERTLTLEHYHRLGGFDSIVGDLLDRILGELSGEDRAVARDLFLALLAAAQTRAVRAEQDLLLSVGARHPQAAVRRVLGRLEDRRLITRHLGKDGSPTWELIHDSLVPRIEAWLSVQDLDRRRAAEILRFHLRESSAGSPSLLQPRQLHLIRRFPGLVEELDLEWKNRPGAVWTPSSLVHRSRLMLQYRRIIAGAVAAIVVGIAALLAYTSLTARARRLHESSLRDRDLGLFDLTLAPFDWSPDVERGRVPVAVDAAALRELSWELHEPDERDLTRPGKRVAPDRFRHGQAVTTGGELVERGIEVRGGDAFLVISGRGRDGQSCPPSVIPLRRLGGYASRRHPRRLHIPVPSCQATYYGTIEVPAGPFVAGGPGEPAPRIPAAEFSLEDRARWLATYHIDRTEITNAEFEHFAQLAPLTDISAMEYPAPLEEAGGPTYPRTDINALDADAYCRFLGKELQSSEEWQKAMRGGLTLADGSPNPLPRRNFPWGGAVSPMPAKLLDTGGQVRPAPVHSWPGDISPYGVMGLAGNVQEWTRTLATPKQESAALPSWLSIRITRGGNWSQSTSEMLALFMATENPRSPRQVNYYLGGRCVALPRTQ